MKKILVFLFMALQSCTVNFMLTNNHADGSNDTFDNDTKSDQDVSPDIEIPIKPI